MDGEEEGQLALAPFTVQKLHPGGHAHSERGNMFWQIDTRNGARQGVER